MHSLHHGPDQNGTVLEETGYENTYAAATAFARKARREYGKCQAVCESTGNLWIKTYEAFEDRGIPIELANPMKVRAIAEAGVKTDKVDARTLAHLLRTNLIARCHVAERGVRGVRQLLRERNNLVKARTQAINRLHNLLDRYDLNPRDFAQDIWRERPPRLSIRRVWQIPTTTTCCTGTCAASGTTTRSWVCLRRRSQDMPLPAWTRGS